APLVHAEGVNRLALHEGAAEMLALGEGRGCLAGRHVDDTEVRGSGLVSMVVVPNVLEAVEAILEDHRRRLDHEEVEGAEPLDGRPCFAADIFSAACRSRVIA